MGPEDPQGWCSRPGPIDDLQLRGAGPEGVRGFGGISADPKVRGESVEAFEQTWPTRLVTVECSSTPRRGSRRRTWPRFVFSTPVTRCTSTPRLIKR